MTYVPNKYDTVQNTTISNLQTQLDNTDIEDLANVETTAIKHGQIVSYDKNVPTKWQNQTVVWNDLLGPITFASGGGANAPVFATFQNNQSAFRLNTGGGGITDFYQQYHLNHDFEPGLDGNLHIHVATNSPTETGTVAFIADVSYAKIGTAFSSPDTRLATITKTFTGTDQYVHYIIEVPIWRNHSGGVVPNTIDSRDLEIDTLLMVKVQRQSGANGDSLVNPANFFVFTIDLHYKTYGAVGTFSQLQPFDS